jgi:hypothetical protein
MNFKAPQPKNLEEWLEIATDGLAASGRERITREISSHYAAAVESHLAQSESEQDAQAHALAELGAPHLAGIKFKDQYFTESDENYLKSLRENAFKPFNNLWVLACAIVFPLILFVYWMCGDSSEHELIWMVSACISTCLLLPGASFLIARGLPVKAATSRLLIIEEIRWVVLEVSLLYCAQGRPFGPLAGLVFYSFGYFIQKRLGLRRKLRKAAKPEGETPTAA